MKKALSLMILATIYTHGLMAAAQFAPTPDQVDAINLSVSKLSTTATSAGIAPVEDVIQGREPPGTKIQPSQGFQIGGDTQDTGTVPSITPVAPPAACSFISALESAKTTFTHKVFQASSQAYLLFANFMGYAQSYIILLKQHINQNITTQN